MGSKRLRRGETVGTEHPARAADSWGPDGGVGALTQAIWCEAGIRGHWVW